MPAAAMYSILLKKENAHEDPIYCCAWTKTNTTSEPNGPSQEFILTGGLDSLVKVWGIQNNKLELVHTLAGHSMAVVSVAVSPDGYSVASASLDSTLIIWDLLSGQMVHTIKTGATDVWKIAFSPDGTQVASGSHTGKIIIYGIQKGTTDKVLDTRGKFVLSVAWSPDGRYIAGGGAEGSVSVVLAPQRQLVHSAPAHADKVRGLAFSPDGNMLASASDDGHLKVHDVASAGLVASAPHGCWATSVAWSPEGARVGSGAADGSVRVLQADDLAVLHTFQEHGDTVWGIQFNARGDKLLSISKDKCINIYECPVPPPKPAKK